MPFVSNPFRVGTCLALFGFLRSHPGVLRRAKLFNAFGILAHGHAARCAVAALPHRD